MSIEKGGVVLYSDYVTILWGSSLEYITKLVYIYGDEHIWKAPFLHMKTWHTFHFLHHRLHNPW